MMHVRSQVREENIKREIQTDPLSIRDRPCGNFECSPSHFELPTSYPNATSIVDPIER